MGKRSFLLLTACFCLFVLTNSAFGQETTGGIEGTVKDAAGAVVPNVSLTITTASDTVAGTTTTGIGAGFRRVIITNGDGFFRALQVPPGTYDVVTTASSGFGESRYENVLVTIGQNTNVNITVNAGTSVNTVDVVANDAAPVDTTSSGLQETINAQSIELIPKSTGFASLLKTIPGTRPESRLGGYSVDGSSGGENVFVIDGQEITNYRTGTLNETYNIPTQLVQEVQVRSTGFEAAFGGATGGVVSVVTRGGSDKFHGEMGIQFEVPKLNGKERPLLNRLTFGGTNNVPFSESVEYLFPEKARGNNYFPTFNLGGPIVKKRLWFYTSYTPRILNTEVDTQYFTNAPPATRTFVTSETYSRKRTYQYAFARLDGNVTDNFRLTSTFLWNPVVDEGSIPLNSFTNISSSAFGFSGVPTANYGGSIGTLTGNDYTSQQGGRQSSNLFTFSGVWTPRSDLVVDARYSRNFLNEKNGNYFIPTLLPQVSACSGTASFPCVTTGANSLTTKDVSVREAFDYAATFLFEGGGTHELKGGYQVFSIFNDVQSGNNAIGQLRFNFGQQISTTIPGVQATPGAIGSGSFRRQGTNGSGSNLNQALFIQDKYQPNRRLTLNLGVRIESENLPTFNQFPSAIKFGWSDKIAPRLGVAFDVLGDGRTRIFASYGKFYDRLKFALPRGLFGGDVFLEDYFEIFPGDVLTNFNIGTIVGNFSGPSVCPSTGTITAGVRSRCQRNLRVNANEPGASPFLNGAVDPDLRPFQQTEFTVGFEHQLSNTLVFRARFTHKNVDEAVEDAGIINALGSEAYIIGNPGRGLHLQTLQALGYNRSTRPERVYDGLEFVLERRFAKNWYFNANYTLSQLWGNYSGLSSSDEPHLVDGRLAPGVTRAFDLPFIGFTALGNTDNGPLQTDRPHVFNIYGSYSFDWMGSKSNRTDISGFQTITSGTPQTTTIYGASTVTPQIYLGRGDMGRSPIYSQTDLAFTHRYKFGNDGRFTIAADLNFLNLFDQDTVTGVYTTRNPSTAPVNPGALGLSAVNYANGYTSGTQINQIAGYLVAAQNRIDNRYGLPFLYQPPRQVRFGFRFLF
jgi:hypothetical protein